MNPESVRAVEFGKLFGDNVGRQTGELERNGGEAFGFGSAW